jgi:LysM repeat protein
MNFRDHKEGRGPMNNEEPYRDQAERLRRRIERINEQTKLEENESLPPREQIHRETKKKTKIKLKYPVIRLLVLIFILLPIIYFSVISYLDGHGAKQTLKTSGNANGFETINYENQKDHQSTANPKDQKNDKQPNTKSSTAADNTNDKKANPISAAENPKDNITASQKAQASTQNQTAGKTTSGQTGSQAPVKPAQKNNSVTKTRTAAASQTQTVKTTKIIYHRVKPKETLFRIAINYYKSNDGIRIIKNANHLKSDQVYAGQLLKIPLQR